jgi:hypothetical protein
MAYRVICSRCGFKKWDYETRREWTGLRVCDPCFDTRHPQDYVKAKPDRQRVPDPWPEPADVFLTTNQVTADDL